MSTDKLDELETQVDEGLFQADAGNLKVAVALKQIHEGELWPQDMPWPEYVWRRFEISETWADRLINFVEVRDTLDGDRLPDSERQTRALKEADKEDWQSIWDRVCQGAGNKPPAGRMIKNIIETEKKRKAALERNSQQEAALAQKRREVDEPTREITEVDEPLPQSDGQLLGHEFHPEPDPENFSLTVTVKCYGVADINVMEDVFKQSWKCEKTNVRGEGNLGVKFECTETAVSRLMHLIEGLLNGEITEVDRLDLHIDKVKTPVTEEVLL